jgi:hypothetical protein
MTNSKETGHARNVANFEKLIFGITAQGAAYNPANAQLKPDALNSQLAAAQTANEAVNAALTVYKNAVGARNSAFEALDMLVTRINNALKASGAEATVIQNTLTLVRKLKGRRAKARKSDEEKQADLAKGLVVVEISASQLGFDSRLDNLDKLIRLLATVAVYAPNEADLKVESLKQLFVKLKAGNSAVAIAQTQLNNARITRNETLYHPANGMVSISTGVKLYVKSVFGASSPQYKALSALRFITAN